MRGFPERIPSERLDKPRHSCIPSRNFGLTGHDATARIVLAMRQTLEQIEAEILGLPEAERARLAKSLLLSLGESESEDVEGLWADEAERRYLEIERGEVTPIPSEDVLREARYRLK